MNSNSKEFNTPEEWKAFQIWSNINRYYSEIQGYQTDAFPKEFLNEINFEILNRKDLGKSKRYLLTITNTYKPVNLRRLHAHMKSLGINKKFIDKSVPYKEGDLETKRYLIVAVN